MILVGDELLSRSQQLICGWDEARGVDGWMTLSIDEGGGEVEPGAGGRGIHDVEDPTTEALSDGLEIGEHDLLDASLPGCRCYQVVDEDVVLLSDAVQSTSTLFEAHE